MDTTINREIGQTNIPPYKPCWNFTDTGTCRFGAKCKFAHIASALTQVSTSQPSTSKVSKSHGEDIQETDQMRPKPRSQGICFYWQRGACKRGEECKYLHIQNSNKDVNEANPSQSATRGVYSETKRHERVSRKRQNEERKRQDALRKAEAEEKHRQQREEEEAHLAAARRAAEERAAERQRELLARRTQALAEESSVTLKHIAFGTTIVKFAAGLEICDVVTGFESCRVQIKQLPLNATIAEVSELFTSQGVEVGRFHILGLKKVGDKQEATVIVESEAGTVLATGLDGIDFRGESLTFDTSTGSMGGMGSSTGLDPRVLSMSWRASSARYVATFNDMAETEAKVRQLNGRTCGGRAVQVEKNKCPPGAAARYWTPNSISVNGLPATVSYEDVATFVGTYTIRQLKSAVYDESAAIAALQQIMGGHASEPVVIRSIQHTSDGRITAEAQFSTWERAKKVQSSLTNSRLSCIGNGSIFFRLPDPHYYTINIHPDQYTAQKAQWDYLAGSATEAKCRLQVVPRGQERVQIRLIGADKKAIGSLKVRVENLVRGERFDGWHRMFTRYTGSQFLRRVFGTTGAFAQYDRKVQAITICGDASSVQRAQKMIRQEIERLASEEHTVKLKRQSVGFFVRTGLKTLKEAFGEDCVVLNTASFPAEITVRGGEETRHMLDQLITDSLNQLKNSNVSTTNEDVCPSCYDQISSPEHLRCGHAYCNSCLRHYLTSASERGVFPLVCMGDEARCKIPISIPTIQRFLTTQNMDQLLQGAFISHVNQHPHELKYCPTPDCGQIYRTARGDTASVLTCPSCFTSVCDGCGEGHDGLTCEEHKIQNDPTEQEKMNEAWAMEHNVKKCPSCQVWMEKTEGCNHMTCKCGAHVCWVCMKMFTEERIYDHMQEDHGSIGLEDQMPIVNDIEVERRVLERYRQAAHVLRQTQREEEARRQAVIREAREEEARRIQRQAAIRDAQRRYDEERLQRVQNFIQAQRQQALHTQLPPPRVEPQRRNEGSWCVIM